MISHLASTIAYSEKQTSYAAANTFLDSFAIYRQRLGLAATSINIGVVAGVGVGSRQAGGVENFRNRSYHILHEQDILDAVEWAILRSKHSSEMSSGILPIGLRSTLPLSDPSNRIGWARNRRMAAYHGQTESLITQQVQSNEKLKGLISSIKPDPSILNDESTLRLITEEVREKLANFLLKQVEDLDVSQSLG